MCIRDRLNKMTQVVADKLALLGVEQREADDTGLVLDTTRGGVLNALYQEAAAYAFPGVEELRKLCYEDLDAALQMGLEMSIEELRERGVPIHRNTQGALDWLLEHRKG